MAQYPLRAKLTAADSVLGEPAPLEFRLINDSNRNLVLLRWHTPLEGVAGKIFRVFDSEGDEVAYRGIMAKRGRPKPSDYISIASGASVSTQVDLADVYDLSRAGAYSVEFVSPSTSQLLNVGEPLAKSPDELEPIRIPANTASLQIAESSARRKSTSRESSSRSANPATSVIVPVAKALTFANCDATSQTTVTSMDSSATSNARLAHDYLSGLDSSNRPTDSLYNTWFGAYTASRFSTVLANYDQIASTLEDDDIAYDCAGASCQSSWFAYVVAGGELKVFLCPGFWAAGSTGFDSRWGTIIHELSHEVASTDDNVYGQTACQNLATNDPDTAIDNADNYEYFVEDFVTTLAEGCTGLSGILDSIGTNGKALAKRARRRLRRR